METKNVEDVVLKAVNGLHFDHSSLVVPQGHGGGGLALFWKDDGKLEVISACVNYFDTKIVIREKSFYATFVYGDSDHIKRRPIWEYFKGLATSRSGPWFLAGDFNDIVDNSEKREDPKELKELLWILDPFYPNTIFMI